MKSDTALQVSRVTMLKETRHLSRTYVHLAPWCKEQNNFLYTTRYTSLKIVFILKGKALYVEMTIQHEGI